jgi:hypothetical protein
MNPLETNTTSEERLTIQPPRTPFSFSPVSSEGVTARLKKGESAARVDTSTLVLDTGQPERPALNMRSPTSQEALNQLYRDTLSKGIIDHHEIDASVAVPEGLQRHCTTAMIALAPDLVLEQIRSRNITEITSHQDSDLDSLSSSYLAKSLKENLTLPSLAKALAEHVDLVDFGLYREPDTTRFIQSLAGVFGSLKRTFDNDGRSQASAVWSNAQLNHEQKVQESGKIIEATQQRIINATFELLNACEFHCKAMGSIDLTDISQVVDRLPQDLRDRIEKGQASYLSDIRTFEQERATALKTEGIITDKLGNKRTVPVLIFKKTTLNPLAVTNLCYMREPPDTIIAIHGGQNQQTGRYSYNIGVKPETAQSTFSIEHLAVALSKVESELREPMLKELESKKAQRTISETEEKLLVVLTTPRKGFEHLKIGDPTVCVAGGSLVAASMNALMDADLFTQTVLETLQKDTESVHSA